MFFYFKAIFEYYKTKDSFLIFYLYDKKILCAAVAQSVRAPDCGSGGP